MSVVQVWLRLEKASRVLVPNESVQDLSCIARVGALQSVYGWHGEQIKRVEII